MSSQNFVRPTPMTDALYEYALAIGLREPDEFRALREETGRLTNREMQIDTLISEGMQTKQIAAKLFISERTVETHVTNILNKLGLSSRL